MPIGVVLQFDAPLDQNETLNCLPSPSGVQFLNYHWHSESSENNMAVYAPNFLFKTTTVAFTRDLRSRNSGRAPLSGMWSASLKGLPSARLGWECPRGLSVCLSLSLSPSLSGGSLTSSKADGLQEVAFQRSKAEVADLLRPSLESYTMIVLPLSVAQNKT